MAVSSKHEEKRNYLLEKGMELLWLRGYNGTSVGDIVKSAEVPKGSFYTYFESKEDFAVKALDKYFEKVIGEASKILEDDSLSLKERVFGLYAFRVEQVFAELDMKMSCLALSLGNEMSGQSEAIRQAIVKKETFVKEKIQELIHEGQLAREISNRLSPEQLVNFIEDAWKGAMVSTKEYQSKEPLSNFLEVVKNVIL